MTKPLALALLSAAAVVSAQAPAPQPPPPTFRTEANYVRVDAYPTRDGAPIPDLTQDDFEILESGVPQKIEQFERVVIRAAGPQETRVEPSSVAEARSMAQSSRARLFVVFLDTYHVDVGGSHSIRRPLIEALDRVIGQDDLVAVMTPEMAASDITFARKTTTIAGFLTRYWPWGERDRVYTRDTQDQQYEVCYPNQDALVKEMIARRHEKMTLDAIQDLARVLRGVREERKAILAVSEGWLLFRPNPNLVRPVPGQMPPGTPQLGVDPRSGRLTAQDPRNQLGASSYACDRDRLSLSNIDSDQQFRDLLDEANRANASFYPIDPRGLPVFDTPINAPAPLAVDAAMLRQRETTLRTLADATDGVANLNSNDLGASFRKIVADLSSYYLLGYYSSGRLDGRFHPISVRVKRPGVQVRARRGYLAATPGAAAAATTATRGAIAADVEAAAVSDAVAPLASFGRELPLRLRAAAGWKADGNTAVWVVGEVSGEEWKGGAEADALLAGASGATLASAHATLAPAARSFSLALAPTTPLAPGEYTVRVRARPAAGSGSTNEAVRFVLPASPAAAGTVVIRRGPSTANREVPTADLRFRRNEQVRIEVLTLSSEAASARLLDRAAKPLAVPVSSAIRSDADGTRWVTAQLALAPLAPGDYVVEVSAGGTKTLAAFRIVP
jgi:VWFA-related protein